MYAYVGFAVFREHPLKISYICYIIMLPCAKTQKTWGTNTHVFLCSDATGRMRACMFICQDALVFEDAELKAVYSSNWTFDDL